MMGGIFQRRVSCTCVCRVRCVVFKILGEGLETLVCILFNRGVGGDLVLIPTPTTLLHRDQHQRKGNIH